MNLYEDNDINLDSDGNIVPSQNEDDVDFTNEQLDFLAAEEHAKDATSSGSILPEDL